MRRAVASRGEVELLQGDPLLELRALQAAAVSRRVISSWQRILEEVEVAEPAAVGLGEAGVEGFQHAGQFGESQERRPRCRARDRWFGRRCARPLRAVALCPSGRRSGRGSRPGRAWRSGVVSGSPCGCWWSVSLGCDGAWVGVSCDVVRGDAQFVEDGTDVVEGGRQVVLVYEGLDFEEGAVDLGDAYEYGEHRSTAGFEGVVAAAFLERDPRDVARPCRMACAASASPTSVSCSGLEPDASLTAAAFQVRTVRVLLGPWTLRTRNSWSAVTSEPSRRSK